MELLVVRFGKIALPLLDFVAVKFSAVASSTLPRLTNSGFAGFPLAFFFFPAGVPTSSSGEPSQESPASLKQIVVCLPLDRKELVMFEELRSV